MPSSGTSARQTRIGARTATGHDEATLERAIVRDVPFLCPTPKDRLVDTAGRPYFLWDSEMSLARFEELLRSVRHFRRASELPGLPAIAPATG